MYINILVLRRDKEVIVFDAGFGVVDHPDRGWLMEGLETIGWDHDMGQAVETRRRVFKQAAQQRTPCFGFHVPWPGLGGIVPRGPNESYDWAPRRIFWR